MGQVIRKTKNDWTDLLTLRWIVKNPASIDHFEYFLPIYKSKLIESSD